MKQHNLSVLAFRNIVTVFGVTTSIAFYALRLQGIAAGYFSTLLSAIALIAVLYALKSLQSSLGSGPLYVGFRLIFLGLLCSELGMLLWLALNVGGSAQLASSLSTLLFYITYILNFFGYLKIAFTSKVKIREFWGMVSGFSILGLILLTISSATHPNTLNLVSVGYVLGDFFRLVVISLVLQMAFMYQGGKLSRYWMSIFIGNMFIIIANFTASILQKEYFAGHWPFTLVDLIFIGGYLFVAHGFYGMGDSVRLAQQKIADHVKRAHAS